MIARRETFPLRGQARAGRGVAMTARGGAFTMVELVIGMLITSIVAIAVGGVSRTLSASYQKSDSYAASLQSARIAMLNVQGEIRQAKLVTEATPGEMILWQEPNVSNGYIMLDEIVIITLQSGQLVRYQVQFPSAWIKQWFDYEVLLDDLYGNPGSWSNTVQSYWWSTSRVLASGVASFAPAASSTSAGGSAPPLTTLVTVHLTTGTASNPVTLRSETRLRSDYTGSVGISHGHYVLPNE